MLLAAAAWGTSGTAQAVASLDAPVAVGATRTVSGALALWIAAAVASRGRRPSGPAAGVAATGDTRDGATGGRPGWPGSLVVAGLAVVISQVAFFMAVDVTGVAVGTVVAIGSAPIVAGLLSWVIDGHRPTRRWWVATAVAIAGVSLVLLVGAGRASVDAVGVLLALLGGSAYGVVTVASRRVLDTGLAPTVAMARVFLVGAAPAVVLLAVAGPGPLLGVRGAVLALWLGVVTVAVPYLLFAAGLRTLPPATVGTLTLAEPLVAAVLGVALLGERPGPWSVLGAALLCVGLALATGDGRRVAAPGP